MADEETEQEDGEQQDPLELLEARARGQLKFLLAAGISSVLFMLSLGFTYLSLSGRIMTATEEPLMEMNNLAGLVLEEYESLHLAVEFHNHLLESVNERIDGIDPSVDQAQFAQLQALLREQESDFQHFLESAKLAVNGLARMVSGSRDWRDEFNNRLDDAIASSQQRAMRDSAESGADSETVEQLDSEESATP